MRQSRRPLAVWVISTCLLLSLVLLLLGQTTAVFHYELAVSLGLQEPEQDVSRFGVQVNRAFGVGDTLVYIPLIIASLAGLLLKRRWSLVLLAAVMGISAYWPVTVAAMMLFLQGEPGYRLVPGAGYAIALGAFFLFGVWGIGYLLAKGHTLVE